MSSFFFGSRRWAAALVGVLFWSGCDEPSVESGGENHPQEEEAEATVAPDAERAADSDSAPPPVDTLGPPSLRVSDSQGLERRVGPSDRRLPRDVVSQPGWEPVGPVFEVELPNHDGTELDVRVRANELLPTDASPQQEMPDWRLTTLDQGRLWAHPTRPTNAGWVAQVPSTQRQSLVVVMTRPVAAAPVSEACRAWARARAVELDARCPGGVAVIAGVLARRCGTSSTPPEISKAELDRLCPDLEPPTLPSELAGEAN